MPKTSDSKQRILALMRVFEEQTDEAHQLTLAQLGEALAASGFEAGRGTLYDDIETLQCFGMDVRYERGTTHTYFLASRVFELPELKLLVDAVQASHLVTTRKTMTLIKKLGTLASRYEATQLQRQVFVANRIKSMNESVYYSIDKLHAAIAAERRITFQYTEYAPDKSLRLRKGGGLYVVSPYMLTYDMNNYYLVGRYTERPGLTHFRVDRMARVEVLDERAEPRGELDPARYAERVFSMFVGEERLVRVRFADRLATVVIDRFGKDVRITDIGDGWFTAALRVAVSTAFLTWVFQFGADARIIAPEDVVAETRTLLASIAACYQETAE